MPRSEEFAPPEQRGRPPDGPQILTGVAQEQKIVLAKPFYLIEGV